MKLSDGFELVNIAEENIAVPVGYMTEKFQGVVVLNEAAAFLLENMKQSVTIDDLVRLLIKHYDVDHNRACEDVNRMIGELRQIGLVLD